MPNKIVEAGTVSVKVTYPKLGSWELWTVVENDDGGVWLEMVGATFAKAVWTLIVTVCWATSSV